MVTALLLIDLQNDYFPSGKMELEGTLAASLNAKAVLDHFRNRRLPIIHIQHISVRPGATFFLPATRGVEIQENVRPSLGETVVQKNFPNAFRQTPLLEILQSQQITRVVLAGMMTHMCVDATTRAAADLGFECTLLHDACATRTLTFAGQTVPDAQVHAAFLAALTSYARVVSTQEWLTSQE